MHMRLCISVNRENYLQVETEWAVTWHQSRQRKAGHSQTQSSLLTYYTKAICVQNILTTFTFIYQTQCLGNICETVFMPTVDCTRKWMPGYHTSTRGNSAWSWGMTDAIRMATVLVVLDRVTFLARSVPGINRQFLSTNQQIVVFVHLHTAKWQKHCSKREWHSSLKSLSSQQLYRLCIFLSFFHSKLAWSFQF